MSPQCAPPGCPWSWMTASAAWCVPVREGSHVRTWIPATRVKGCGVNTPQTSTRGRASVSVSTPPPPLQHDKWPDQTSGDPHSNLTPFSPLQLTGVKRVCWKVLSIRADRPFSPAVSTSACAVTGRSAVCRAATLTWCCPGPIAPCPAGFRCPESAAKSGFVTPRLRPAL